MMPGIHPISGAHQGASTNAGKADEQSDNETGKRIEEVHSAAYCPVPAPSKSDKLTTGEKLPSRRRTHHWPVAACATGSANR